MKKKTGKLIACFAMIATLTSGLFAGCSTSSAVEPTPSKPTANVQFGIPSANVGNGGISLMSETIDPEDYEQYGVSPTALESFTITATVYPAHTIDKHITWSVSWQNASSNWATGKKVTDYVTVTGNGGDNNAATLQCLQAFGEKVVVKAKMTNRSDVSATMLCGYKNDVSTWKIINENDVFEPGASMLIDDVADMYEISSDAYWYVYYGTGTTNAAQEQAVGEDMFWYHVPHTIYDEFNQSGLKSYFDVRQDGYENYYSELIDGYVIPFEMGKAFRAYLPFIEIFEEGTAADLIAAHKYFVGKTTVKPSDEIISKYSAYYNIVSPWLAENENTGGCIAFRDDSYGKVDINYSENYIDYRSTGISLSDTELTFNS